VEIYVINLVIQTTITAIVLLSMAFRMKGNYLAHLITMIVAVVSGLVIFSLGFSLTLSDSSRRQTLWNPALNLATYISHGFLGLSSFASGIVLVAFLLRDRAIHERSNLIAKIVPILWVLAYAVGVLFFVILHVI
jgi:cytochrome b subunit of formate dehydrogenase